MPAILTSLLLALRQLADPAILRILAKSAGVTLVLFAVLAWGGWWLLDWGLEQAGLGDALFSGAGGLRGLAAFLLAAAGLWLIWRIVAMAVIQFFVDEVVEAVEARHYPQAALAAREPGLGEQARSGIWAAVRALLANLAALPLALALLATGVGPAILFWLVNAVLLGRELSEMVWLRHRGVRGERQRHRPRDRGPIRRGERLVLGGVIAALLAVPLAGFLAPVLGAAAATHLLHRKHSPRTD